MTGLAMEPAQLTFTKLDGITTCPRTLILTFSLREKKLAARFWSSLGRARLSQAERMSFPSARLDRVSPYQKTGRLRLPRPEGEGRGEGHGVLSRPPK